LPATHDYAIAARDGYLANVFTNPSGVHVEAPSARLRRRVHNCGPPLVKSRRVHMIIVPFILIAAAAVVSPAKSEFAAVSPDGRRVAFVSTRDGATDVYTAAMDGTHEVRLTNTPEEESTPEWSADGKQVRFAVVTADRSRIDSVDLTGAHRTTICEVPGRAPHLSPDGKRVLFATGSWTNVTLFVADRDGSNRKAVTDGSSVVWNPSWSPDGKRIAFTGRDSGALNIWVMSADGSERRQLTHIETADGQAQVPAWSPDGRQLAIQVSNRQTGHIWIVDSATGAGRKIAPHAASFHDEVPVWFPDGKRIAFQSDRTGTMQIWTMNIDGSGQQQLTGR
jgi:TolB protein